MSDAEAAEEFSSVLADVVALVDQFSDHCFVLGGVFNVDFDKHNIHSRLLLDVCNDNDFRFAALHEKCFALNTRCFPKSINYEMVMRGQFFSRHLSS